MAEWNTRSTFASGGEHDDDEDPGLIILYKDDEAIHRALRLGAGPILQGPNPAASGEDFRKYVYTQLVGGVPDKLMHCVEDARATTGPVTEFFPNIFQRLPRNAYNKLVIRIKQLFPPQDPWVQALPGPLGTLVEIRGGTVEVTPVVVVHRPFKYP